MKIENFTYYAKGDKAVKAAELFAKEIELRSGSLPIPAGEEAKAFFVFETDSRENKDSYSVKEENGRFTFTANGIRGLIYAFALFLKKTRFCGEAELTEDISGDYTPAKRIRGHQLGYRTTPNSYDAWSLDDYYRYYLDIMFMGSNIVEHIPYENGVSRRNRLMKYDEEEFLVEACRMADELDLDVSLWFPNGDAETDESAAERRKNLAEKLSRLNVIFPPGGDPGDLPADVFIKRCSAIKNAVSKVSGKVEMWPSAQAPHSIENWGETFVEALKESGDTIDGIIMGPNHAFPLDELRRRVPSRYPLRFYPDITHNVRCEYPVHFDRDDWHYALTTGLSRECTNPRPLEYTRLHHITQRYFCGSVSYSEGITDDVNKFIWSALDNDPDSDPRESLLDYSRLFFFGAPEEKLANGIQGLELDWACDPAENPSIDSTFETFLSLSEQYPFLNSNWRFNQLLFRARCDKLIRDRRIFENGLVKKASKLIEQSKITQAQAVLKTDFSDSYKANRAEISRLAQLLFEQIGLQLNVKDYCADSWERGAVLETIDLPVTDRAWLLNRLEYAKDFEENEKCDFMKRCVNRNKVEPDEFYFSVARNGLKEACASQSGEVYMNFQGDRPYRNNGTLPTCCFNIFDNFTFSLKTGGFTPGVDYKLTVSFPAEVNSEVEHLRIFANGNLIFDGPQLGGKRCGKFEKEMLPDALAASEYLLPAEVFENGCLELKMEEEKEGIMFAELRITKNGLE